MKIKAVINTKGGVGKSTLAFNILPILFKNSKIYEIDGNNSTKLKNSAIQSQNFSCEQIDIVLDKIDFSFLRKAKNKETIIIDVGAGADTQTFIKNAGEEDFFNEIEFFVPANDDFEQFTNILKTINMLKNIKEDIKVNLVLNRVDAKNSIKSQFINIFGSEEFGIESRFPKIEKNIKKIYGVPNTPIFGILKTMYQSFMVDVLPSVYELLENQKKYKQEWAEKGEEEFIKGKNKIKFFKKVKQLEEKLQDIFNEK